MSFAMSPVVKSRLSFAALVLMSVAALPAQAEVDFSKYTFLELSFGKDYGRLGGYPTAKSGEQSKAIHAALDLPVDRDGAKSAGLRIQGEFFGMRATEDIFYVSVIVPSSQQKPDRVLNGEVSFGGEIARAIYDALPMPAGPLPLGATTKQVANLKCVLRVVPKRPVTCTVKQAALEAATIEAVIRENGEWFTQSMAEELIEASDL
jgi:hypothetical protein